MSSRHEDERFMAAAIRLSRWHLGLTGANPSVGCLIVRDGVIVGRGVTAIGGRPHAETQALALQALQTGDGAQGEGRWLGEPVIAGAAASRQMAGLAEARWLTLLVQPRDEAPPIPTTAFRVADWPCSNRPVSPSRRACCARRLSNSLKPT